MDNAAAKANQFKTWQGVAPGWKKWNDLLRRQTMPVTERFLELIRPGERVLDIASGVGDPSISIAERVGPAGSVLGTDLVEEMLGAAREHAASRGVSNIEFKKVDGEELDVPKGSFDVVTMRWGLMFMPDAVACLKRARAALKPGGAILLACWSSPAKNPWASIPITVLSRHIEVPTPPPGAPGLFAFADPSRLRSTMENAGFLDVTLEEIEVLMSDFATGEEFLAFTLEFAGPIASLFARVPQEQRGAVAGEIAHEVERAGGGRARLPGVTWFASARC
jgi:ubiquinone/menaquinone biosynthesis C-methylase UbiE